MRCLNKVLISGVVLEGFYEGTTPTGAPACTFYIEIHRDKQPKTNIKVNAYGHALVSICKREIREHKRVIIVGELMNRANEALVTVELRMHEVIILP